MRTSELIAFAIGLTAGFVMGGWAALMLRPKAPLTSEQRMLAQMRETYRPEPVATLPEPFAGYSSMPIQSIRESLRALSLADREAVRVYEEATLKRKGILNVLRALEEERVNGNA